MDIDKMNAGQKTAAAKAAASRKAKMVADAKAGRMLPKSIPTTTKATTKVKDNRSWGEKWDNITRGPNAPAKKPKPSGPGIVERVQNKLDGVARGKDAAPKRNATAVKAAASRRNSTPSNAVDAQRAIDSNKKKSAAKAAAERRSNIESRMKSRGQRVQAKDYKGKYWGPDVFKGDQNKIDAWKKAGKPRNADGSADGSAKG